MWNKIGEALGISFDFRQELWNECRPLTNQKKLEIVLEEWIQSKCSEVSWRNLIEILNDLKLKKLAKEVEIYLKNRPKYQNPISSYIQSFKTNAVYIFFILFGIFFVLMVQHSYCGLF